MSLHCIPAMRWSLKWSRLCSVFFVVVLKDTELWIAALMCRSFQDPEQHWEHTADGSCQVRRARGTAFLFPVNFLTWDERWHLPLCCALWWQEAVWNQRFINCREVQTAEVLSISSIVRWMCSCWCVWGGGAGPQSAGLSICADTAASQRVLCPKASSVTARGLGAICSLSVTRVHTLLHHTHTHQSHLVQS